MTRELKVFGWIDMNPYTQESVKGSQVRAIVAAHSGAEMRRITGMSPYTFAQSVAESGNESEVAQAMAHPQDPFFTALNARAQVAPEDWFPLPSLPEKAPRMSTARVVAKAREKDDQRLQQSFRQITVVKPEAIRAQRAEELREIRHQAWLAGYQACYEGLQRHSPHAKEHQS